MSILNGLTWSTLAMLLTTGLLDDVISDYLWARAVVLTSATVATVGLAITIPCALLTDAIMHPDTNMPSIAALVGALLIIVGFLFVNIFHEKFK